MNKKSIIALLMSLIMTLSVFTVFVSAQPEPSDVSITFIAGTEPTEPVDPDDPTQLLDPPGQGTGQPGPLSIDYVPTITFGSQAVSYVEQVYQANELKPFIQFTDTRGTGAGWHVTASASAFSDGTDDTLAGAVITFSSGEALSPNPNLTAPLPSTPVTLATDDTEVLVMNAVADSGLGTWIDRWYPSAPELTTNDNVTLTVPAGVAKLGAHTATITWTLLDAPQ